MNFTIIGAVLVLVLVVVAIWGRKIISRLQEGLVKRYCMKAVLLVELMSGVMSEQKLRTAVEWAALQLAYKWRLPVPKDMIEKWVEWAVHQMKAKGGEVKAAKVLDQNDPKILLQMSLKEQARIGVGKQF